MEDRGQESDPAPGLDLDREDDGGEPPGMPRWVKVASIVVGVLILVFLALQLIGVAGNYGSGAALAGITPPLSLSQSASSAGCVGTTLSPRLREAVLTTHIASSVAWLGAVVAYIGRCHGVDE